MTKKLRIGVFGGYRGMTMIKVLMNHPYAELAAVCDKYEPILEDTKKSAEEAGMMETGRLKPLAAVNVYTEGDELCKGKWKNYDPKPTVAAELAKMHSGHNGSDFYPTHFFIEKILGHEDGKWSIDVYQAVDMGICGILAYRSVLGGNVPIDVPNLREAAQRDKYRNDNACTNPEIAGDQLLPCSSHPIPEIPDNVYDNIRQLWLENKIPPKKMG